jgi:hypothetical protein
LTSGISTTPLKGAALIDEWRRPEGEDEQRVASAGPADLIDAHQRSFRPDEAPPLPLR